MEDRDGEHKVGPEMVAAQRGLADRVRRLCKEEDLFGPGAPVLAMVSGGQDSLSLLHLLASGWLGQEGPGEVQALHVNHHLRGDESMADQALVETHCRAMGVPLTVVDAPVDKKAGNVQEAAREVRARAAREAAVALGADRIGTGHTLDDQVETMLYRLGRYGGLAAMRGIRPRNGMFVRPLLDVRRRETEAYCRAVGLVFAVDRGNEYSGYARTALRRIVLPAWEEALPGAAESAARSARVAGEAEEVVAFLVARAEAAVAAGGAGIEREWSASGLLRLDRSLRRALLRSLLDRCPGAEGSRRVILALEKMITGSGSQAVALAGGWVASRMYDRLVFRFDGSRSASAGGSSVAEESAVVPVEGGALRLGVPGEVLWKGLVVAAAAAPDGFRAHDPHLEAYVDARALEGPVTVRGPVAGDAVRPLGAPGERLVQDVLVDMKVPALLRSRIPMVVCAGRVVWLCGLVQSQESRIMSHTRRVVRLSVAATES